MAESAPVNDVLCSAVEYLVKLGANLRRRSETLKDKRIRREKLRNTLAVQKAANKVLVLCELSKKSIMTVESSVNTILSQIKSLQGSVCRGKSSSSENISSFEYFEYNSWRLKIRKQINLKHYTSAKVVATTMPTSLTSKYPVFFDCKLFRLRKRAKRKEEHNEKTKAVSSESNKYVKFNDNVVICGENKAKRNITCDVSVEQSKGISIVKDGAIKGPICNTNQSSSEDDLDKCIKPKTKYNDGDKDQSCGLERKFRNEGNQCSDADNCVRSEQDSLQHITEKTTTDQVNTNDDIERSSTNNDVMRTSVSESNQEDKKRDDVTSNGEHINNKNKEENVETYYENLSIRNNFERDKSEESNSSKRSYIKCVNINSLLRPDKIPKVLPPVYIDTDSDDNLTKILKPKRKSKNIDINNGANLKTYKKSIYWKQKEIENFKPRKFTIHITRLPKLTVQYLESQKLKRIIQNGIVVCEKCPGTDIPGDKSSMSTVGKDKIQSDSDILSNKNSLLHNSDSEITDEDSNNINEIVKRKLLCDSDSDSKNPKETSPLNKQMESLENSTHTNKQNIENARTKSRSMESESNIMEKELHSHRVLVTPDITDKEKNDNYNLFDKLKDSKDNEKIESDESSESKQKRILESINAKKKLLSLSSSSEDEMVQKTYEKIREDLLKDSPEKEKLNYSDSESLKSDLSNTSGNIYIKSKKRKLTKRASKEKRNSSKVRIT